MCRVFAKLILFFGITMIGVNCFALADDNSMIASLQQEIRATNVRLLSLEKQLAEVMEQRPQAVYIPASEENGSLLRGLRDVQLNGHIDVQWNQNLTQSGGTIAGGNAGRIFDHARESFTVNQVELDILKEAPTDKRGAGFRIDLAVGEDAGVVDADATGGSDDFDLQQAYVEYHQPLPWIEERDIFSEILPHNVNIIAGRFTTLAGMEVIEPQDNWNVSRSFAFGLSIPFVHTGVRMNFGIFRDYFDVYVGVNNGWGLPVDNNTYKTLETAFGWNPVEDVELFHSFYWGPENALSNGHKRFLNSNTMTWEATDKLTLMGEINIGNERRQLGLADRSNVTWHTYTGYARYQVTEKAAVSGRVELYRDQELFTSSLDRTLWEYTITGEYALTDNLLARLEYRFDKARNTNAFGFGVSHQSTLSTELIYLLG